MTPFGTGLGEPTLPTPVIEQRFRRGRRKRLAVAGVMRPEAAPALDAPALSPLAARAASTVRLAPVFAPCGARLPAKRAAP